MNKHIELCRIKGELDQLRKDYEEQPDSETIRELILLKEDQYYNLLNNQ